MDTKEVKDAMQDGQEAHFTMRIDPAYNKKTKFIPVNQFCKWKIDLNIKSVYVLEITRDAGQTKEVIGLKITGEKKTEHVEDF
jgi:hypothetical protein